MQSRYNLVGALARVAAGRELDDLSTFGSDEFTKIEIFSHEIAHAIDYGNGFDLKLDLLPARHADQREVATLKIQVHALRRLGVRISLRRLWRYGNWYSSKRPALSRVLAPLNKRERRCVRLFVREVRAALKP